MKIIGITYINDKCHITLKTDSSLLINRHPFFIPAWDDEFVVQSCLVVRICRLGKNIEECFVHRYYDMVAYGLDFRANASLKKYKADGDDWSCATSFDYSLCVGEFLPSQEITTDNYAMTIPQAIKTITQFYTIRQGDLIFIDKKEEQMKIEKNMLFRIDINQKNVLYCKIK